MGWRDPQCVDGVNSDRPHAWHYLDEMVHALWRKMAALNDVCRARKYYAFWTTWPNCKRSHRHTSSTSLNNSLSSKIWSQCGNASSRSRLAALHTTRSTTRLLLIPTFVASNDHDSGKSNHFANTAARDEIQPTVSGPWCGAFRGGWQTRAVLAGARGMHVFALGCR